jgi:hypothetical protein
LKAVKFCGAGLFAAGPAVGLRGQFGLHSRKTYVVLFIREPVQHIFMPRSNGKSHLRFENPFLGSHFDK